MYNLNKQLRGADIFCRLQISVSSGNMDALLHISHKLLLQTHQHSPRCSFHHLPRDLLSCCCTLCCFRPAVLLLRSSSRSGWGSFPFCSLIGSPCSVGVRETMKKGPNQKFNVCVIPSSKLFKANAQVVLTDMVEYAIKIGVVSSRQSCCYGNIIFFGHCRGMFVHFLWALRVQQPQTSWRHWEKRTDLFGNILHIVVQNIGTSAPKMAQSLMYFSSVGLCRFCLALWNCIYTAFCIIRGKNTYGQNRCVQ